MIKSLTIENFLSHKDTCIQLHPRVNVFLGESDVGKSAIFSAIWKVVENRPAGNDFVSWWAKECYIELQLTEGDYVQWNNQKGQNTYVLYNKAEDESFVFTAFGQGVPELVKSTLDMEEINFQHQLTNAFLLQLNPGERARYLNQVVNLDSIDTAIYNINKRLKEESASLGNAEADVKKKKEELEQFNWLEEAEESLNRCLLLEHNIEEFKKARDRLGTLLSTLIRVEEELAEFEQIVAFEEQVNSLLLMDEEIEQLCDDYDELGGYLDRLNQLDFEIEKANKIISAQPQIERLLVLEKEIESLHQQFNRLDKLLYDLNRCEEEINEYNLWLNSLQTEFNELMPAICPLCDQEIKANERHDHHRRRDAN